VPTVEAHTEERSTRHRCGGGWRGVEAVEAHMEERSMRCRRGGGPRGVETDIDEERAPAGVWRENYSSQG
jgi:hypothetical protein